MSMSGIIVTHPNDNVATALNDLVAGQTITVSGSNQITSLVVGENINRGHKISLIVLNSGQLVIKYGEHIGCTTASINAGRHVHTHNMRSMRIGGVSREVQ